MSVKDVSRRSFLKILGGGAAALTCFSKPAFSLLRNRYYDPRPRVPNPYVNGSGQPILVSVRGHDFPAMLATALSVLGGFDRLVGPTQSVLIKPNLVTPTELYPTTSDANSVLAILQALSQVTSGTIKVGDGGVITYPGYYGMLGLDPLIPQAGGQLVEFTTSYEVRRSTWSPQIPDFNVYTEVYNAPVIINLCNLKRHYVAGMTGALKNHVGTVTGPFTTGTRAYLHSLPQTTYLQNLAEIAGLVNSELVMVDARQILVYIGPFQSSGGRIRHLNRLIVCGDPVATDVYCAHLLAREDPHYNSNMTRTTVMRAQELDLGTADLNSVEIHEVDADEVSPSDNSSQQQGFELRQNYPEPFNGITEIAFTLPYPCAAKVQVFNVAGRNVGEVRRLTNGSAGEQRVSFDASHLPSGTYFYRLKAGDYSQTRRMTLVK